MRGTPLPIVALLVLAPIVASLPSPLPAPLPVDLSDADLLRLLAARQGLALRDVALHEPADATLESTALRLAARAGTALTDNELAELRALDPRVAAPSLALLLAVEQAWDLRDEAFAHVPPRDHARLRTLEPASREAALLAQPVDTRPLYEAAILLLDTLDARALPALREAYRAVPWPAQPLVDNPVLRLGGSGDNTIGSDRIVQIDPAGNDVYRNNAGASTFLDPGDTLIETPIGLLIDFAGNDRYDRLAEVGSGYRPAAQGSGMLGIGILLEYEGNDVYIAGGYSQGAAAEGVGYLRDMAGTDEYYVGDHSAGWSGAGPGILREDGGNDKFHIGSNSGGASSGSLPHMDTMGLLWDRSGLDRYDAWNDINDRYGWVSYSGTGWMVDESSQIDYYRTAEGQHAHGCNDCAWRAGYGNPPLGIGMDNSGGLAALLHEPGPYSRALRS